MEWGGLLRKVRAQETAGQEKTGGDESAPPAPATPAADPTPQVAHTPTTTPLIQRRAWASGAFLAAAARLVARGEETTYTLRRVVEWATAATGARRAILWAIEEDTEQPLTMLAWAASDGWRPGEAPAPRLASSPAMLRATRNPETIMIELSRPMEQAVGWGEIIGAEPIALCAAISSGKPRGILTVAGLTGEMTTFGEDARAALAACAALAAIVFERQRDEETSATAPPAPVETTADATPAEDEALVAAPTTAVGMAGPFGTLPERAVMLARLGEEVGRARRFGHPLALLYLDVDRVEEWVAQAGEGVATQLLDHLVGVTRGSIRDVDLIGRGDGDELILILPVSEVDDALRVGERIREALEQSPPPGLSHPHGLRLTVSGGAVGYPDDGADAEELLNAAERTVLYAKRMGRDQIRLRGLGEMESPTQTETYRAMTSAPIVEGPRITQVFQGLIDALATAGDAHDQARPGHGRAVGQYARALAEACGLDPEQARTIELAGLLHDAGKIGLPEAILGKRGALTAEERAILREQPAVGKLMLMQVPSLEGVIPLVEYAHERYDGNGYPAGLRGNQIPFGSRIIALAEGYEAMISDRPYRRALSHSMAIAELWREAGGRYDPRLVDTFVRLVSPNSGGAEADGWDPERLEEIAVEPLELDDEGQTVTAAPDDAMPTAAVDTRAQAEETPAPDEPTAQAATTADPQSRWPSQPGQIGPLYTAEQEAASNEPPAQQEPTPPTARAQRTGRPNTGPLPTRPLDQAPGRPPAAPEQQGGEPERDGPEQSSVDDTILKMSQTTLLRMAELGRNTKRRTGTLSPRAGERDDER